VVIQNKRAKNSCNSTPTKASLQPIKIFKKKVLMKKKI